MLKLLKLGGLVARAFWGDVNVVVGGLAFEAAEGALAFFDDVEQVYPGLVDEEVE